MRRVVITGLGVVSPLGNHPDVMFDQIKNYKCMIQPIRHFDTNQFRVKLAAEVTEFDYSSYFSASDFRFNDRFTQFARYAAKQAFMQSKLQDVNYDRDRFGVVFGSGVGGMASIEKAKENLDQKGPTRIFPHFIPMNIINAAAAMIAIDVQAYGPCIPVVTGCAAGSDAIGEAYLKIKTNQLDVVIAGASEASITPLGVGGFMAMRALSEQEDVMLASIPFDQRRSGFVMGEGAGALVLEDYDHAHQRKAPIFAEIIGYGSTCDAYHITAPKEDGTNTAKAMSKAMSDAHVLPNDIDYINAHGTSTPLNDITEVKAIQLAFSEHGFHVPISSTKSYMGHLLGACGAVEAIVCVQSLLNQLIPATLNTQVIDDAIDANIIINQHLKADLNIVMSNSLGFGGHNASLIFKRWSTHVV